MNWKNPENKHEVICMIKYMVKQHNIYVHDNITQLSINLI